MQQRDAFLDVPASRTAGHIAQCNGPSYRVVREATPTPSILTALSSRRLDRLTKALVPAFVESLRNPVRYLAIAEIHPYTLGGFVPRDVHFSAVCPPGINGHWRRTEG